MIRRHLIPILLLAAASCSPATTPAGPAAATTSARAGDLVLTARSGLDDVAPEHLVAEVSIRNAGRNSVRIEFGACSFWLRAYPVNSGDGEPVWDMRRTPNPDPETGLHWACPMYLAVRELRSGQEVSPGEFRARIPVPDVLGDSLPDGAYRLVARVAFNEDVVDVPAGEVTLVAAQAPLPRARTVEGFRFEARTAVARRDPLLLRSEVVVTNTGAAAAEIPMMRNIDCAVHLSAYPTVEARARTYRVARPIWGTACPFTIPRERLAPGESRRYEASFPAPDRVGSGGDLLPFLTLLWLERPGPTRVFLAGN